MKSGNEVDFSGPPVYSENKHVSTDPPKFEIPNPEPRTPNHYSTIGPGGLHGEPGLKDQNMYSELNGPSGPNDNSMMTIPVYSQGGNVSGGKKGKKEKQPKSRFSNPLYNLGSNLMMAIRGKKVRNEKQHCLHALFLSLVKNFYKLVHYIFTQRMLLLKIASMLSNQYLQCFTKDC